jgi:ketosteroid isomerase-like protein
MKQPLLLLWLLSNPLCAWTQTNDEAQILQLIHDETAAFRQEHMSEVVKKYWLLDNKSYMTVTLFNGIKIYKDSTSLVQSTNKTLVDPVEIAKSEHTVHVNGDAAYAFHEQKMYNQKTKRTIYSHEARICRKVKGVWKLHVTSVHQFVLE